LLYYVLFFTGIYFQFRKHFENCSVVIHLVAPLFQFKLVCLNHRFEHGTKWFKIVTRCYRKKIRVGN